STKSKKVGLAASKGGTGIARQYGVSGMHLSGKPQVMVVDDALSMCSFLKPFLDNHGYSAITLSNAEEAVRRYDAERPAAVILDVVMPGRMDGLAALARFNATRASAHDS